MQLIHERINRTPYAADFGVAQDRDGREVAVAVLKATFLVSPSGELARPAREEMLPVCLADVFYDKPENSSLRYPADIVPEKPGTDVAVNGNAYANGRAEIEVALQVGSVYKAITATGSRVWQRGLLWKISRPEPFLKVPVRYEQAFGGVFEDPEHGLCPYPQNPIGQGFHREPLENLPLPCLELPGQPVRSVKAGPVPAGLGFIPPGFAQRARFAGTFDEAWERSRRPLFPVDFDPRYWNAVPEDQVHNPKLKGGEVLTLRNLHPRVPELRVTLPRLRPTALFRVKKREETLPMQLDTLLVEPDEARLVLAYSASAVVGLELKYLKSVTFRVN